MAREDLHFRLRIPEDLKLLIQKVAEANHRSMTAEIVSRLEDSFSVAAIENARDKDIIDMINKEGSSISGLLYGLADAIDKAGDGKITIHVHPQDDIADEDFEDIPSTPRAKSIRKAVARNKKPTPSDN